jgi:hypothetical protein
MWTVMTLNCAQTNYSQKTLFHYMSVRGICLQLKNNFGFASSNSKWNLMLKGQFSLCYKVHTYMHCNFIHILVQKMSLRVLWEHINDVLLKMYSKWRGGGGYQACDSMMQEVFLNRVGRGQTVPQIWMTSCMNVYLEKQSTNTYPQSKNILSIKISYHSIII